MFYYILHFYMIHIAAVIAAMISGFSFKQATGPIIFQPLEGYGYKLWIVYLVWFCVVAALYPLCRWYAKYKFSHPEKWWLSYL
jgi:hypothetical protein